MIVNLRKFLFTRSFREKGYLLEATAWMALARFLLLYVPFKKIAPHLGRPMRETEKKLDFDDEAMRQIRSITQAIQTMSEHLPWECKCLVQSIAAKRMLKRRGIKSTLYLGVLKKDGFAAHAWLRVGSYILTGRENVHLCSVVSIFGADS